MPFEQVPELLVFLTGVHVSVETVRRLTERAGAAQVAREEHHLDCLERDLPDVPAGPERQQVSADGVMIPLTHGEWTDGRTIAIGKLGVVDTNAPAYARDITYLSRLCTAHAFIRQAALPFYDRGIAPTDDTVVAVMDGADWLQDQAAPAIRGCASGQCAGACPI